jgi:hypothetical protein
MKASKCLAIPKLRQKDNVQYHLMSAITESRRRCSSQVIVACSDVLLPFAVHMPR